LLPIVLPSSPAIANTFVGCREVLMSDFDFVQFCQTLPLCKSEQAQLTPERFTACPATTLLHNSPCYPAVGVLSTTTSRTWKNSGQQIF